MKFLTPLIAALMIAAAPLLLAQEEGGRRRTQGVTHAFERIEKSLRELSALPEHDTDENVRALIENIRRNARELKRVLEGRPVALQVLYEIRLIDLEAEGATETWRSRFGALPELGRPHGLPQDSESKLTDFPGMLAAPNILTLDGQKAELSVGEERSVSFLKRLQNGTYAAETTEVNDGLALALTGDLNAEGTVDLDLRIDVKRIVGKTEYVPDAPTVGMPLLSTSSGSTRLRLVPGVRHALVPFADGSLVVVIMAKPLKVDPVPPRGR